MAIQVRKLFFLIISTLFLIGNAHSQSAEENVILEKQIEAAANQEIESSNIPSLQISIGVKNRVIYEGAFGFADVENAVKATPETKYRTASIAKWFTATATMRLAENEKLNLDKSIQAYCPEFPQKKWIITPRQLLAHTSGIRHYMDYDSAISLAKNEQEKAHIEKKRMIEIISSYTRYTDVISPLETFKEDPLLFEPGTNWEYTSFGYRLLACVMQGAAKLKYTELMRKLVFEPAHMNNTVEDDAWAIIPNRASGYRIKKGEPLRKAEFRDISENLPAGGYLSTSSDLVKFALSFNEGLVAEETRSLMSSPVTVKELNTNAQQSWRDAIPSKDKYGYGLMLFSNYKKGMVGHTGRQAGGSAILILSPDEGIAIAIMTNAKGWNGYLNLIMKLNAIVKQVYPNIK